MQNMRLIEILILLGALASCCNGAQDEKFAEDILREWNMFKRTDSAIGIFSNYVQRLPDEEVLSRSPIASDQDVADQVEKYILSCIEMASQDGSRPTKKGEAPPQTFADHLDEIKHSCKDLSHVFASYLDKVDAGAHIEHGTYPVFASPLTILKVARICRRLPSIDFMPILERNSNVSVQLREPAYRMPVPRYQSETRAETTDKPGVNKTWMERLMWLGLLTNANSMALEN